MTIALALSVLVFILGGLMYWFAARPKLQEIGRLMFAVGLFVSLLQLHGGILLQAFKQ
jgi:Na+/phosphate symporter